MKRAFVTGSTGLLGSHLVPELLDRGYSVTALARSVEKARRLFGEQVEVVEGDVRAPEQFEQYLTGCDVVFHLAAYFREYRATRSERELLHEVNVRAPVRVVEAARRCGVPTFVFVSSAGVLRPEAAAADGAPAYDEGTSNLYFRSKIEAEQALLRFADTHGSTRDAVRIVTVRPSMMMGPRDLGPTPAGRFVRNFLAEKIPIVPPAKVIVSDPRDVARALAEAAVRGRGGVGYTLGGDLLRFGELMAALEDASGVPAPERRPPYAVASVALGVLGWLAPLTGRQPPMRRSDLQRLRRLVAPDARLAEQDLGFRCRPLEETVGDTVRWFQQYFVDTREEHVAESLVRDRG